MADNIEITSGTGTTIAADEVTRNATPEKQQIVKIGFGVDGAHDGLAAETTPLPVKQGVGTEAAYTTLTTKAYSSITGSFTSLVDPSGNAKLFDFFNDTDAFIILSYDAGATAHDILPAYSGKVVNLAALGLKESGVVHIKYSGSAPTVGNVYAKVVK